MEFWFQTIQVSLYPIYISVDSCFSFATPYTKRKGNLFPLYASLAPHGLAGWLVYVSFSSPSAFLLLLAGSVDYHQPRWLNCTYVTDRSNCNAVSFRSARVEYRLSSFQIQMCSCVPGKFLLVLYTSHRPVITTHKKKKKIKPGEKYREEQLVRLGEWRACCAKEKEKNKKERDRER